MIRLVFLVLFISISFMNVIAHEGKHENKTIGRDTITLVGKDTIAINGVPVNSIREKDVEDSKEEPFELKPAEQMFAHLHNKIVHFPIALTLVAFLFLLLNIKKKNYDFVVKILLGISLATSIAAFFTGNTQLSAFIGDPKEWLANTHRLAGIISIVLIFLWFVSLFIQKTKKFSWIVGLIVVAAISITGFLGGVLAH